ncbi:hypothetical protein [uncultured Sphingomonas sp.]|uniref:hypothetical protein n=1 Tax=uncultured Sphingomonas sp. TaxID=158754 RepID=UPI0035CC66FA
MTRPRRLTGGTPPPVPSVIHAGALRVRGRVAERFLAGHALAPEDAIDFTPDPADRAAFDRLRALGVVRQAGGRWWFDLVAYHLRQRARSRAAVLWSIGLALSLAGLAMLLY